MEKEIFTKGRGIVKRRGKYIKKSIAIMEDITGGRLPRGMDVHHKNGNPADEDSFSS